MLQRGNKVVVQKVAEGVGQQLWGTRALELATVEPMDSWSVCFACLHHTGDTFRTLLPSSGQL
jgi:hypothetical protein